MPHPIIKLKQKPRVHKSTYEHSSPYASHKLNSLQTHNWKKGKSEQIFMHVLVSQLVVVISQLSIMFPNLQLF